MADIMAEDGNALSIMESGGSLAAFLLGGMIICGFIAARVFSYPHQPRQSLAI